MQMLAAKAHLPTNNTPVSPLEQSDIAKYRTIFIDLGGGGGGGDNDDDDNDDASAKSKERMVHLRHHFQGHDPSDQRPGFFLRVRAPRYHQTWVLNTYRMKPS